MSAPPRRLRWAALLAGGVTAAALLWSGLPFGPRNGVGALTNCDVPSGVGLDAVEAQFLVLLNDYRATNGLQPLTIDSRLNRAAQWMSNDMLAGQYLDHTDRLGRNAIQRMGQCGHPANAWFSEIVQYGPSTAAVAINNFKGSPGHNAAMLDPLVHSVGIGKAGPFWTADFSALSGNGISGDVPLEQTPTLATPSATATTVPPTATPTEPAWRSVAPGLAKD